MNININIIIFIVSIFSSIVALYFGVIRLLDNKKKEFLLFLVMYMSALIFMIFLGYIYVRETAGENWHLHFHPVRDQIIMTAFYGPPTFVIAYLLYPFKSIKRNRFLIWILLGYTLIMVGGSTLISILVAFSNM